jgi:two-component system phosphate regulon sensor histidine kinase PhoR
VSGIKAADSIRLIKSLKPVFFSITSTDLEYKQLDSIIKSQLIQKKLSSKFSYHHLKNDTVYYASNDTLLNVTFDKSVNSNSIYLKRNELIQLQFKDPSIEALQRSVVGILLSLLLSVLIIFCLFYLLKIIKKQKELAEIKNDLISNITHEFKTPIATISTAIEAIESFNVLDDKEKTQKYLSMSNLQLKKLHQMVEKLLETATLDSENLMLKKEEIDLVELIKKISLKHQVLTEKKLDFSSNISSKEVTIDSFHFENSVSNLIDNAIKYGGDKIEINVNVVLNFVEILIADNGSGIEKNQQEKIFDKFYRIPKGNRHDVKGFGIGLYYTKKIVEKHHGKIQLTSDKQNTLFKIIIPNE